MGWSVDVEDPWGEVEVRERVSSYAACPGNILSCMEEIDRKNLAHARNRQECQKSLKLLIGELKRGNEGRFNDAYAIECDILWSSGAESQRAWKEIEPLTDRLPEQWKTYERYTGYMFRERLLEDAERFYLYYRSGYRIRFTW